MTNKFEAFSQPEVLDNDKKELPLGVEEFVGEELKKFRAEIGSLKKDETLVSENLSRVNVEELAEEDLEICQELKDLLNKDSVTQEETEEFFEKMRMYQYNAKMANESRGFFSGYIAGQSMALLKKSGY